MKRILWGLALMGAVAGVAHHQLTAQDAPAPLPPAEPASQTFPAKPTEETVEWSKRSPNEVTVVEMRSALKRLENEAIDRMDAATLHARLIQAERSEAERQAAVRLEAIARELATIAKRDPLSKGSQRAQAALQALSSDGAKEPTIGSYPPGYSKAEEGKEPAGGEAPRFTPPTTSSTRLAPESSIPLSPSSSGR